MTTTRLRRRPRNLALATFAGQQYRSTGVHQDDGTVVLIHDSPTPPPDDQFSRYGDADIWVRTVRVEECDRVVEVSTSALYGRYLCGVQSISEDGMALLFCGKQGPGFEMIEPGSYQKTVHVSELRNYHEVHNDVQFAYWRYRLGPRPRVGP